MSAPETIQNAAWALSLLAQGTLLTLLFSNRNYRLYPYFTAYNLANLVQAACVLCSYRVWGLSAMASYQIYWSTQGLVLVAKALALSELSKKFLGYYRGIWALAWRCLAACALVILSYSFLAAKWRWQIAVLVADRGLELAIAGVVVSLFLFARYYKVRVARHDRFLAAGFCLYSCAVVLDNTIIERFLYRYSVWWNIPLLLLFCVSVLIWIRALRAPVPHTTEQPALVDAELYWQLSPQINLRLRALNEQLLSVWKPEAPRS
ncbi:MAG: hypothetical protein LAN84_14315 [Acidobacteriia bacterium]|nr:hypothetical protein [Terriglobia bacterium]